MIRVTHISAGLSADGAETMLYQLVTRMSASHFSNEVISLTSLGAIGERLKANGIRVRALGMRPGVPNPFQLLRLSRWLKQSAPHLVQTWMYHADLLGGLAARAAGIRPVVWGIHHANLDPGQNKRLTILTARACAMLSNRLPAHIVCCSEASREVHARFGYSQRKMEVIPNGFDLHQFRPDAEARASFRQELGVTEDTPLIGMAARFHPQKGHRNFVAAAALLRRSMPGAHFVLCGGDVTPENTELASWIAASGNDLASACHLLGTRRDMPRFFAGLDIATSASRSEAFPLAVGEAMACGTPCVVTDVGDSAFLVGETGRVVPAENPGALAEAWLQMLAGDAQSLRRMGSAARKRIEQRFELGAVVERYQDLYTKLLDSPGVDPVRHSHIASVAS